MTIFYATREQQYIVDYTVMLQQIKVNVSLPINEACDRLVDNDFHSSGMLKRDRGLYCHNSTEIIFIKISYTPRTLVRIES